MSKKDRRNAARGDDKGWSVPIWVAVVTGIVTIVVAIIGLVGSLFGIWVSTKPTSTAQFIQHISSSPTPINTLTNTQTSDMIFIEPTPIPSQVLETAQSSTGIMYVVLTTKQTRGRNPLKVIQDARDSYFVAPEGTIFQCGACIYTWNIRTGGTHIYGPENTDGRLEYTFGQRGSYFVSVYVCRSGSTTECVGSGAEIVVE